MNLEEYSFSQILIGENLAKVVRKERKKSQHCRSFNENFKMNVLLLLTIASCTGLNTDNLVHVVLQLKEIFHPGFVCLLLHDKEECKYCRSIII